MKRLVGIVGIIMLVMLAIGIGVVWRLQFTPEWRLVVSSDREVREKAVLECLHKSERRARWCAARAVDDDDPVIVGAGIALIVRREFRDYVPKIQAVFETTNEPDLKVTAIRSLAQLQAEELAVVVREAMADEHVEVRKAAIQAIGDTGDKKLIPVLMKSLPDSEGDERGVILATLIQLKAWAALPFLIEEMQEEETLDAEDALAGLIAITGQNKGLDADAWRQLIRSPEKENPTPTPIDRGQANRGQAAQ